MTSTLPRLVVAGLGGDSGKTIVSVGLALALRDRALRIRAFKKGPDYIDAAWLSWATGTAARNLDTYLMGIEAVRASFTRHAIDDGVNVIEGNRGVYDGVGAAGKHSTAELAKLLRAPVVLVLDATKVTRTAAALVLGCQVFDRDVEFAGVILNRVAGGRHASVLRESIEATCGVPVLGVVPRSDDLLPARHLGLVTPQESAATDKLRCRLRDVVKDLDLERLLAIGARVPPLATDEAALAGPGFSTGAGSGSSLICRIGYLADSAFTFYYPENLEALESAGAVLVPISAQTAARLPADLHALYIGGGFPETHATRLSSNVSFLRSLADAASGGLPVYAECGGLMLLSSAIRVDGRRHSMAGVLPFDVEMQPKPQGHGYTRLLVDAANPFFSPGTQLTGHEFHYSQVLPGAEGVRTACAVTRGSGCLAGRDGVVVNRVFASYTHLHALATPEWAAGVVSAARRFAET